MGTDTITTPTQALVLLGDSLLIVGQTGPVSATQLDRDVYLVKTGPDGSIAPSFGQNGSLRFDFAGLDYCTASDVWEDPANGSFLVLGSGRNDTNTTKTWGCLQRVSRTGQVIPLSSTKNDLRFEFFGLAEYPNIILRDQAGRYLIAGSSFDPNGNHPQPVVLRLTADFEIDSTFGSTGKLLFDLGVMQPLRSNAVHFSGGFIRDMILLPDTGVAICGGVSNGSYYEGFAAKVDPQGAIDPSFGPPSGYISFDLFNGYDTKITSLVSLPDGTLAFAGSTGGGNPDQDLLVGRLNPQNGTFVHELIDLDGAADEVEDLLLAADGSLLASATSEFEGTTRFSLASFPDPTQLEIHSITTHTPDASANATNIFVVAQDDRVILGGYITTSTLQIKGLLTAVHPSTTYTHPPTENVLFSVYPNPTTNQITIRSEQTILEIELVDLQGRTLQTWQPKAQQELQLQLPAHSPGVYFLRINRATQHKLVLR